MRNGLFVAACFASVAFLSGCDTTAKAGWSATVNGTGSDVTGGSVGFAVAPLVTPAPTPWAVADGRTEQLEKGNSRKVAAQVAATKQILPMVVVTPARAAVVPVKTPANGAWYNGFLP